MKTVESNSSWAELPPPREFQSKRIRPIASEEIGSCPLCGHPEFMSYAVGFDYESLTCSNPWRFVRCAECDHTWLNPRPAVSELGTIYPPTYYAYHYEDTINPIAVKGKEMLDSFKMTSLVRAAKTRVRSFVDIGCGTGRFLRYMEKHGVPRNRIYGLELDEKTVGDLAAQGFRVFCQRVEDCREIPENGIDLATMFHVIEHVDDPMTVVSRIAEWLAPGGVLAMETPNIDSIDARLFRNGFWGGYHIPRHWNLFSTKNLIRLCEANGLEVLATKYQTGHSFWMWSFHHWLRFRKKGRPRLARWFDPMKGLPFLVFFTGFDRLRAMLGFKTSAVLVLARKPVP